MDAISVIWEIEIANGTRATLARYFGNFKTFKVSKNIEIILVVDNVELPV